MSELLDELLHLETESICKRYKIEKQKAKTMLQELMEKNVKVLQIIQEAETIKSIQRRREYKNFVKDSRKKIYYHLRQYHADSSRDQELIQQLQDAQNETEIQKIKESILTQHVSSKERYEDYPLFFEEVFRLSNSPQRILDVACGVNPIAFPFQSREITEYFCFDRDALAIQAVETFFQKSSTSVSLTALPLNLNEVDWPQLLAQSVESKAFDLALLLKLVPVIYRQERELLSVLAQIPAKQIIISGCKSSLTKKEDISRREDRILREFIDSTSWKVIERFDLEYEFGYLLE